MKRLLVPILVTCLTALSLTPLIYASDSERAPFVVSPAWLAAHLQDSSLVLLHIGDRGEYDEGHIPGARYISLQDTAILHGEKLTLEMPPVGRLQEVFQKLGVSDSSRIILYFGSNWATPTARVYFTLDYLGLSAQTSILDGGMPAWQADGHPLSQAVPAVSAGSFTPHPRPELIVQADWVRSHLRHPGFAILDARLPQFFEGGDPGRFRRAGHIPGAANIPYPTVLDASSHFRSRAELVEIFQSAGVKPGAEVVTYCHIGQQASLVYFVARYLGYDARLYDGSWEDWSAREDFPVENGSGKP